MNNFRNHMTSPFLSICVGYVYIAILAIFLYSAGFYENYVLYMGSSGDIHGYYHSQYKYLLFTFLLFFIHEEPVC